MSVQLQRIFVYGTLKHGQPNYHFLESAANGFAKFMDNAITVDRYPLVIASSYNIPFMLPFKGKGNFISGEVYEVDEKMLTRLDQMEQHPDVYKREEIPVTFANNTFMSWCYILQKPKPKLLDLKFLDNYDNNKYVEERKYVRHKSRKDDAPYSLEVMETD